MFGRFKTECSFGSGAQGERGECLRPLGDPACSPSDVRTLATFSRENKSGETRQLWLFGFLASHSAAEERFRLIHTLSRDKKDATERKVAHRLVHLRLCTTEPASRSRRGRLAVPALALEGQDLI